MRLSLTLSIIALVVVGAWLVMDLQAVGAWAIERQRWFQNEMASALRALRAGDAAAYVLLLGAAGSYGFVHAVGPGHGKYLIGGVGLGTSVSMSRLLFVSVASSLAQALWAIVIVYGGFSLLEASARGMTSFAEDLLAPASYAAIGAIGLLLCFRGGRSLWRANRDGTSANSHDHAECGCGSHHHAPIEKIAALTSLRECAALIGGVAIRPCTGAIFLLVIGWQLDIRIAAAVAVLAMGLGTAALTSLVAVSSVAARGAAFAWVSGDGAPVVGFHALQIACGLAILIISASLLSASALF
ncbi:MAG: hypothetical protein AAF367_13135 [Pseudomonadota bacterium]